MKVAIIPARGDSKRIPKKNIRSFHGKPMISWSINAAFEAGCFDEVVVSTDSSEIAEVATCCGAKVPFLRPKDLADDYSPLRPVIQHAVTTIEKAGKSIDYVCCIAATAPLLSPQQIISGYETVKSMEKGFVVSVGKFVAPIQRALRQNKNGTIEMIRSNNLLKRSQDFDETFFDACQVYWGSRDTWMSSIPFFSDASRPLIVPRETAQDIGTIEDWLFAEKLFNLMVNNKD